MLENEIISDDLTLFMLIDNVNVKIPATNIAIRVNMFGVQKLDFDIKYAPNDRTFEALYYASRKMETIKLKIQLSEKGWISIADYKITAFKMLQPTSSNLYVNIHAKTE